MYEGPLCVSDKIILSHEPLNIPYMLNIHGHAITQDYHAPFLIATGEIMEGEFPPKSAAMVKEFILNYQKELEEMWETEKYVKLPPIK